MDYTPKYKKSDDEDNAALQIKTLKQNVKYFIFLTFEVKLVSYIFKKIHRTFCSLFLMPSKLISLYLHAPRS